jgi:hypothetical protein
MNQKQTNEWEERMDGLLDRLQQDPQPADRDYALQTLCELLSVVTPGARRSEMIWAIQAIERLFNRGQTVANKASGR